MDELKEIATSLGVEHAGLEVKAIFREIALRTHPDKVPGKVEIFKRAALLYENLTKTPVKFESSFDDLWGDLFKDMSQMFKAMETRFDELHRRLDAISKEHDRRLAALEEDRKWRIKMRQRALEQERRAAERMAVWRARRRFKRYLDNNPQAYGPFTALVDYSDSESESSSESESDEEDYKMRW